MNTISIEGKIEKVTSRMYNGKPVLNIRLHDVVQNEHNVYFDIAFWNEEAVNAQNKYNTGDIVSVTGKLKVKPYTAKDGNRNLMLALYDISSFKNLSDKAAQPEPEYNDDHTAEPKTEECDKPENNGLAS